MSIRKLLAVAHREYAETIKTKAFLFGILLMPAIIVAMIFLSAKMTVDSARPEFPVRLGVVDRSGRVAAEMARLLDRQGGAVAGRRMDLEVATGQSLDGELDAFRQRVQSGTLSSVVDVPADVIQGGGACTMYLRGLDIDDRLGAVHHLLNEAVKTIRFADAGVSAERLAQLSQPVPIRQEGVREAQGQRSRIITNMMTPFVFVFMLFMGVFGVSQGLLTSVIEEKSSRVVEVLLSALSPFELMAGKVLGMAGVGLTMVVLWSGVGYAAATWKHVQHLVQIAHLGEFVLYYVLGYLLISSILAAVGSACNTMKEAQPLMAPLTLMLVIPLMFWLQIVRQPESTLSFVLSLVPPMTPFIMLLRITSSEGGVPVWQQIAAPVWLAGWVLIAMWAASRVFRVGLLMYGKPPGLRELLRWVRYR